MDNNKKAPVTMVLLWINIIVHFLVYSILPGEGGDAQKIVSVLYNFGLVPAEFWHGSWWQPLTSMFLHGSFFHILVNMLALWSLGTPIEKTLGSLRFGLLYFISGFTGALFVITFQMDMAAPTIGASGAILGLLGALAVFFPNSGLLVFFFPMKARTAAILFGAGSVVLALLDNSSGISHLGHLGGLIGGVLYSRYALGLHIGKSTLHGRRSGRFYGASGGYAHGGPSSSGGGIRPEEIFDMLNNLARGQQGRRSGSGQSHIRKSKQDDDVIVIQHTDGSEEKIINPTDEDLGKGGNDDSSGGQNDSTSGGKLYFDPVTGKFIIK